MNTQENDISWALKLLEREPDYEQNLIAKNWMYGGFLLTGLAIPVVANVLVKRPLWSGIQRHIFCGSLGLAVGHHVTEKEKGVLARRDAILRDYIQRHPEDFPPPERKKVKDLFERWTPIR